ncbi:MAG: polyprenol monophosphomannose synthase [Actinomycetes bacterium]
MKPLVILPTFNEAENILIILDLVRKHVPAVAVLVVDDGSPDGTADLAEQWGSNNGGVDVLRRREKSGLGSAYRAGFQWGLERGFEILIEMDSDLQHDPAMLPALIHAVEDGADLAIGSRYVPGGSVPGWKRSRRLISQGGNIYGAMVLGLHVRDLTAGFRAYAATALTRIDLDAVKADGYGFQIEMAYAVANNDGRIVEVPITFGSRQRGSSKMSSFIVFEALGMVTWWGIRDRLLHRGSRRPTSRDVGPTSRPN